MSVHQMMKRKSERDIALDNQRRLQDAYNALWQIATIVEIKMPESNAEAVGFLSRLVEKVKELKVPVECGTITNPHEWDNAPGGPAAWKCKKCKISARKDYPTNA